MRKNQLLVGFKKISFDSWVKDIKDGVQRHIKLAESKPVPKNLDGPQNEHLLKCLHAYGKKVEDVDRAVNRACGNTCTLAVKKAEEELEHRNAQRKDR